MTKLLVVDDNEQNRYLLQVLLIGHGYDVTLASDGADALDKARANPPDAIVTDILMPGLDGYALCRQWKGDEQLKKIPLVFYTATYTDPKDEQFGLSMGADRFLIKPQEPEVLLRIIEEVLAEQQSGRMTLPHESVLEETVFFKEYNEVLVRKLEDKVVELESAKACLEREVSERTRAEQEAGRAGREWQRTFDATNNAIWILGQDQRVIRCNKTSERFFPHSCEEIIGKHCWEIVHGTKRPIPECPIYRVHQSLQRESQELQIHGTWYDITVDPLLGEDGQYAGAVHIVSNISERKRTEEALAVHARRVQALLDLQVIAYEEEDRVLDFVIDACLGITQSEYSFIGIMNGAESMMTIHRWSREAMTECALQDKPIEYPICAAGLWGDCVRKREPIICNDYNAPNPNKKGLPNGHVPIQRFVAVPVVDGNHIVAVASVANKRSDYLDEDVSALSTLLHKMWEIISRQRKERERRILEEQYRQAQKMEAIGQLAGGVAHDFNNILQAIVGYGSMLLEGLPEQDERHEFASEIVQGAARAASLTRQLLAFSRRQILEMEDLDLRQVILGMTKMIRRIISEEVEMRVIEGPGMAIIHADRGQMEQVLLNLCVNARDAMPEGGTITIEVEKVKIDTEYCAAHAWASPGNYTLLSVTDTGCGMDVETQARIFEPFFTTKELGKGTGLGLSTVYGIVQQHQGMIQVYSELRKGTTFKVYLPSLEQTTACTEIATIERAPGGNETILVAEDDEALRKLAVRILENAGYTVLLAANGEEAIATFEKSAPVIDLLLLDVVMPKMGGKGVYDVLHRQYPRLRFLFSSGYSANAIHTGLMLQDGIELIQKPYAPDVLLRKVREVLDKESAL